MKVTHLSTSDIGGAGIAAKNLHLGLMKAGVESAFVSKFRLGADFSGHEVLQDVPAKWKPRIWRAISRRLNPSLESYYLTGRPAGLEHFSFPWSDIDPYACGKVADADLVHLHWVSDRFIDYRKIFQRREKRFVWTLHDMNPFTGGCHHSDGCLKFQTNCNYCFQLKGTRDEYLSGKILAYKTAALSMIPDEQMVIVCPSEWLASLSRTSRLFSRFKHFVIPNPHQVPAGEVDRGAARQNLGIGEDEIVFLFVSHHVNNPRKGMHLLLKALEKIQDSRVVLLSMGTRLDENDHKFKNLRQLGYINDPQNLKEVFTAADIYLLPSKAENFPNSIVEANLCGCPVLASNVGGIPEQIESWNGRLVNQGNEEAWVAALADFLSSPGIYDRRKILEEAWKLYDNERITKKYIEAYQSVL